MTVSGDCFSIRTRAINPAMVVHLLFAHAQSRDFDRAQAQPTGPVPIFRRVAGHEVFVGHNVGAGQQMGRVQPAAKRPRIGDDLVRARIAFVRAEYRNPALL